MKPLLVIKPDEGAVVTEAFIEAMNESIGSLARRLQEADVPVIWVDGCAVYWLRPGDSTVEIDARAEAIRNHELVAP